MGNIQQADTVPLYATLLYEVRKELDISIAEYFFLDMVHKLSYQRWCSKSIQKCADDMGITKKGLILMRTRLINKELLEKNEQGFLRVTQKYIEVAVNKVHRSESEQTKSVNKVHRSVNKVHRIGVESSHITDARVTRELQKNNSSDNNLEKTQAQLIPGPGYIKAQQLAESLRHKGSTSNKQKSHELVGIGSVLDSMV